MPQQIDNVIIRGLHRGMADDSIIADSIMPRSQVRFLLNMDPDTIGFLKRRGGFTRLGSAAVVASKRILGLHEHIGTDSALVAFVNDAGDSTTEAYWLDGSSWTNEALGFTASTKVRSVSYLDLIYAVNGVDSPKSWNGASAASWGTTNLVSAPTGSLIEVFRGQMFIADPSTDTIYFSSLPTAGAITWTTATDNFILNPNDGSNMTAMIRYANELVLFKRKYLYRYNGRSVDPDPAFEYGTASQESVVKAKGVLYFYDPIREGIFAYSGGFPSDIGRAVHKYLAAVPTSNEENVVARTKNDYVEFHLGDITVDGRALKNVAVRYVMNSKAWSVRSYGKEFVTATRYDNGTDIVSIQGTTDGFIETMDTGNSDSGVSIPYEIETQYYTLTNDPAQTLIIPHIGVFMDSGLNMSVQYMTNKNPSWVEIGKTKHYATMFSGVNAEHNRIKLRFSGRSKEEEVIFEGFAFYEPYILGDDEEQNPVYG